MLNILNCQPGGEAGRKGLFNNYLLLGTLWNTKIAVKKLAEKMTFNSFIRRGPIVRKVVKSVHRKGSPI